MKFTVKAGALAEEVGLLLSLASKRTTIPILGCVLIRAGKVGLSLAATDVDSAMTTNVEAQVAEPGSVALDGKRLDALLRSFPGDADVVFGGQKDGWINVESGGAKLRVPYMSPDDFPTLTERPTQNGSELPAAVLVDVLRRTTFAADDSVNVKGYGGVFIQIKDGKILAGGTNGNRGAIASHACATEPVEFVTYRATLEMVSKALRDSSEPVQILRDGDRVWFTCAGRGVMIRALEQPIPPLVLMVGKYLQVASESFGVDRGALLSAIRRAELMAKAKADKDGAVPIELRLEGGSLTVAADSPDGQGEEAIEVPYTGKPTNDMFAATMIREFLSVSTSQRIMLRLGSKPKSGAAIFNDGDDHTYLAMPRV